MGSGSLFDQRLVGLRQSHGILDPLRRKRSRPEAGRHGPATSGRTRNGRSTGVIFNPTTSFQVGTDLAAIFIFATEDGTISGWNPHVNPTVAVRMVNRPGAAIYKGLAIAQTTNGPYLYATNFVTGKVEVFDGGFFPVRLN